MRPRAPTAPPPICSLACTLTETHSIDALGSACDFSHVLFGRMLASVPSRIARAGQRGVLAGVAARTAAARNAPVSPATIAFSTHARSAPALPQKPRLVILGTGWGGFSVARHIDQNVFDVHIVSPRNHMLFTPLLASTAVGTLEFRSISEPVKYAFPHVTFHKARARDIDPVKREITMEPDDPDAPAAASVRGKPLQYDLLVVGVGARVNTFGMEGVEKHAHFLKELADARAIRSRIIRNVESATFPGMSPSERQRLLSIVVVGAGPTGIELSSEIHDFLVGDLTRLYPDVVPDIQITIVEGKQVLGAFDASLREYTERKLKRDRIRVRTGVNVVAVEPTRVTLSNGEHLDFGMLVWNTGKIVFVVACVALRSCMLLQVVRSSISTD